MGDWGAAGSGAASGAATGAVIGSVVPGWGTAIGAGVGGIVGGALGYFGGGNKKVDPSKARWEGHGYIGAHAGRGIDETYQRQAPQAERTRLGQIALGQASQLDPAMQAQFREQQMAQANRLGQIASGQMQGAGELAAQRQASRAVAQQQAMARMGRGMSAATAGRGAARNMAAIGADAAGQSQIAALQDQQAANAQLGSLLAQGREADIGMASQNAQLAQQRMLQQGSMDQQTMLQQGGMDQQMQLQNLNARLQMMGMNDQARLAYLSQLGNMYQSEMAGRLGQEQVSMNQASMTGPLLQAAGQIGAAYASRGG